MANNSAIEWTDATWNPVVGCSKVSPGCGHCYAETMAKRLRGMALADIDAGRNPGRKRHYIDAVDELGRWTGKIVPVPEALADPLSWKKPRRVFVNSMSDLFHESLPFEFIDQVVAAMGLASQHVYQVLTKRPERAREYFNNPGVNDRVYAAMEALAEANDVADFLYDDLPWDCLWLGTSCERQQEADERIPHLLQCPAAVRFISAEPLLGPIDFSDGWFSTDGEICPACGDISCNCGTLDWVIVGGESGHNSRACEVAWVRSIVEECQAAGVPVFVKQLGREVIFAERRGNDELGWTTIDQHWFPRDAKGGDMAEWPSDLRVREFPAVEATR